MFSSNTSQTSGGYEIQRSLRFNSADSAYLNRTPASAGNRTTWTWSGWVKLCTTGFQTLFGASDGTNTCEIYIGYPNAIGELGFDFSGGGARSLTSSTAVFRDPSAWYHIVLALDTTQATDSNRVKLYVNGNQVLMPNVGSGNAWPLQNAEGGVNTTSAHNLGRRSNASAYYNGYMTEVNFIDGQALTPSSFGAFDAQTGVWGPKAYAGSYGTNGFYLNFSDNSNTTAATLGKDYSGNGNNWTPNNFSVTAGAGNDSLVDVPTNWGTDTGVGGTVRGNYSTLNPLDKNTNTTLSNGNLDVTASAVDSSVRGTIGFPSSGKWYFECIGTAVTGYAVGIADATTPLGNPTSGFNVLYANNAQKTVNGVNTSYGSSFTTDIIGVAYNADTNEITFYKNNVSQGALSVTSGVQYFPFVKIYSANIGLNFGQRPFAYTAPSGFKALNTQNLPTPTIGATTATQAGKFFNPVLYTGNNSTLAVTGVGFQPDWTWIKERSSTGYPVVYDSVRGVERYLFTNTTGAEGGAGSGTGVTVFGSDGFTVVQGGSVEVNRSQTYVAWNWKANGAGVTNTAGSITSTVSANTTSGFSVVTYTSNKVAGATVGHGLGVAPKMLIVKRRDSTDDWRVYHASLGATQYIDLNVTNAAAAATVVWNDTAPTSNVFSLGTSNSVNSSGGTNVAYCFAEVPGYSKFGSYFGNSSSDGPFVFCGFRPAYVMVKLSSSGGTADWIVEDGTRNPYNVVNAKLSPNTSGAEFVDAGAIGIDFLSNGFKIRGTDGAVNTANTYIFAAFASAPQKFALAR